MSVLVFGAESTVGGVLNAVPGVMAVTQSVADQRRPADCARLVESTNPRAVIYTSPVEDPAQLAGQEAVNFCLHAATPAAIADVCAARDIPLVYLSSSEVFDGQMNMPYLPTDSLNAVTPRGQAQVSGEAAIQASDADFAILRSSWVFGDNLDRVVTQQGLLLRANRISAAIDAIAAPTPAEAVAQAALTMAASLCSQPEKTGVYHLSGSEELTQFQFLQSVFDGAQDAPQIVQATRSEMVHGPLIQANARLDCRKTKAMFGIDRPDWRQYLAGYQVAQMQRQYG